MPENNKKNEIKNDKDIKNARQIVLDAIGEEEKADEEKVNIRVVPGGFDNRDKSMPGVDWGDKKDKIEKKPEKEFITISPEPMQKFTENKEVEGMPAEKRLSKEDIEQKKAQIQDEIKGISEKESESGPEIIKEERPAAVKKTPVIKSVKKAVKKKIKPKKQRVEIPVKLEKQNKIEEKKRLIITKDFLKKINYNNAIYIILYTFIAGIIIYLLFIMAIYNFNPDNAFTRKISSWLPVPAIVSSIGMVEYYDYQDYLKYNNYDFEKSKIILIKQIIYKKIIKNNPSAASDEINEKINKEMESVKLWSLVD